MQGAGPPHRLSLSDRPCVFFMSLRWGGAYHSAIKHQSGKCCPMQGGTAGLGKWQLWSQHLSRAVVCDHWGMVSPHIWLRILTHSRSSPSSPADSHTHDGAARRAHQVENYDKIIARAFFARAHNAVFITRLASPPSSKCVREGPALGCGSNDDVTSSTCCPCWCTCPVLHLC